MSGARQLPDAKYELLIEDNRPSFNPQKTLAIGLVIVLLVVTGFTVGLSWKGFQWVEERTFRLKLKEFSRNTSVWQAATHHRLELYGEAVHLNKDGPNPTMLASPSSIEPPVEDTFRLVCYYMLPSNPPKPAELLPEAIDPMLCTHINVAFAKVSNLTLTPADHDDVDVYRRVIALKSANPSLKVLLSVGGYSTAGGFADAVSTPSRRKSIIHDLMTLLVDCEFDGVDWDWEFPAWGGKPEDQPHFTQLLHELRDEIVHQNLSLLMSVAVAAPKPIVDAAYDVAEMAKYVDFVNVMCYDYHFYMWYLPVTGPNAPLYPLEEDKGYLATLNTNWTVMYWISKGMPREKMVVGLPTYGHSFTLTNPDNHDWNAPASGIGALGTGGFTTYPQLCWFLKSGAAARFDLASRVPYAYKNHEWVSYDEEHSLGYKAEYVTAQGLGGAMVLSLNTDDFAGQCDGSTFPLTTRVRAVLRDDSL